MNITTVKGTIYCLLSAMFLVALICWGGVWVDTQFKMKYVAENLIETKDRVITTIQKENIVLAVQAKQSKSVYLREEQIKKLLSILMPKNEDKEHFMKILKCENGNHDPKRVHVNKEGLGYDLGIAQINSRFHSNRVKEFFGQDFDEAMQDPVKNLVYATYLYQNSGFGPWVCNRIVAERK